MNIECGYCHKKYGNFTPGQEIAVSLLGLRIRKYECPIHGDICLECLVDTGGFFGAMANAFGRKELTCKKCGSKVLMYSYDETQKRWR